jgi:hypothetical protein
VAPFVAVSHRFNLIFNLIILKIIFGTIKSNLFEGATFSERPIVQYTLASLHTPQVTFSILMESVYTMHSGSPWLLHVPLSPGSRCKSTHFDALFFLFYVNTPVRKISFVNVGKTGTNSINKVHVIFQKCTRRVTINLLKISKYL